MSEKEEFQGEEKVIIPEFENYRAEFSVYEREKENLTKEKNLLLSEVRARDRKINELKNLLEVEKSFRKQAEEKNLNSSYLGDYKKKVENKEEKFVQDFKVDFDKLIPKFGNSYEEKK